MAAVHRPHSDLFVNETLHLENLCLITVEPQRDSIDPQEGREEVMMVLMMKINKKTHTDQQQITH